MKTTFMQPCQGELVAKLGLMHRTRSPSFCGTVTDAPGNACALPATFNYLTRKPSDATQSPH